jgi:peroxiredoxin
MPLKIGDRVPELSLPAETMEFLPLYPEDGRPLVVLFFPLAFSSTCTAEMCSVAEDFASYRQLGARVVAVSVDSPHVLARFRAECGAGFHFLSDFNREAAEAFEVLREEPVSVGLLRTTDRSAFVIDGEGVVRYVWFSKNPGLVPPFEEVKEAVRRLRPG